LICRYARQKELYKSKKDAIIGIEKEQVMDEVLFWGIILYAIPVVGCLLLQSPYIVSTCLQRSFHKFNCVTDIIVSFIPLLNMLFCLYCFINCIRFLGYQAIVWHGINETLERDLRFENSHPIRKK
jgi:hypothetical protein